jgi:hypothetical protein
MKTEAGYETNGNYIKFKSGFTGSWNVETVNKIEHFKTEDEADMYIITKVVGCEKHIEQIDINTPFFGNSGAVIPKTTESKKTDYHNDIYGPGSDDYGRDKLNEDIKKCIKQPVRKTAEEILKKHTEDGLYYDTVIKAMHEFASQSIPTDEEIEKQFPVYHQNNLMTIVNGHRQEGAKWLKSKLQ